MSVAAPERAETSSYEMPIPRMDGFRASKPEISRFSGAGLLDPMDEDELALLEAARLGAPVRLIVVGELRGQGLPSRSRAKRRAALVRLHGLGAQGRG